MTVSLKDGLKEGALAVVGTTGQSISYSIVPCVYAKFAIEGSLESGFKLDQIETGKIAINGDMKFSVKPNFSVGVDVLVANAYAGISGVIDCELKFPVNDFGKAFSAKLTASAFFEYQALFWGNSYEWKFLETDLYKSPSSTNVMSIRKDDLKFIEPLPQLIFNNNAHRHCVKHNRIVFLNF